MKLTPEQRAELDGNSPDAVRAKLLHSGTACGAAVMGFKTGPMDRGAIEDWLGEKHVEQTKQAAANLFWSRLAGVFAVIGVLVTIIVWFWP